MLNEKRYLGDSVYAQYDGYHIVLTTENGLPDDPSNTIALDNSVLHALYMLQRSITEWLISRKTQEVINE